MAASWSVVDTGPHAQTFLPAGYSDPCVHMHVSGRLSDELVIPPHAGVRCGRTVLCFIARAYLIRESSHVIGNIPKIAAAITSVIEGHTKNG